MASTDRARELARVSRDLQRLAARLSALTAEVGEGAFPAPTPEVVRLVLGIRLLWFDHVGNDLGEPARNMLLALYAAQLEESRLGPTRLARAAAVPLATALRWIETLRECGLVDATLEPRHRWHLTLTAEAVSAIDAYLAAVFRRSFMAL